MTDIRAANDEPLPLLNACIVVEYVDDQATRVWSWLDGRDCCPPRPDVDWSLLEHNFGDIAPYIHIAPDESGRLESVTIQTGGRHVESLSPLPEGQTHLYQFHWVLKTDEPLTQCGFPRAWGRVLDAYSAVASRRN